MLTEYSPGYAASIAPAKIIPCPDAPAPEVRELLAQALNAARGVTSRFVRFRAKATDADRASLWNDRTRVHHGSAPTTDANIPA